MPSPIIQDLAIFGAGIAAGMINVVVGSGTLITFPTLLAFNFPPVLANVSNNIGLIPGSLTGAWGYRAELSGQRDRALKLGSASLGGGIVGAILLLVLPAGAFETIVPVLIGIALVMVILQPQLATWVRKRAAAPARAPAAAAAGEAEVGAGTQQADAGGWVLWFLVFCTGIYGGYFGAAQGVLLLGLLGVVLGDTMQRVNAVKNILAALVNGIAAIVFIIVSHVDWTAAGIIAVGSVIGGLIGAKVGRKLSPWSLRIVIICVGIAALVKLLV
ncbi:MAG TPA: sulfite exporter TauE/SafE family protein [Trebonia sp.]